MQTQVGRGVKKREGEQKEIITAQPCCPLLIFTVIPWANLFLSQDTVTQTKYSHHMAVYTQRIFNKYTHTHTQRIWNADEMRSYVHTCTQPSTSSSEHRSDSHTALTHLGQGKVASCFLSVGWRVGWSEGGGRGWEEGGGDWRGGGGEGGGTSWLSVLTLSRDRGGGQGGKDRGIMRDEGGGDVQKGRKQERKKKCDDQWRKLIVHRTSIILDATLNLH